MSCLSCHVTCYMKCYMLHRLAACQGSWHQWDQDYLVEILSYHLIVNKKIFKSRNVFSNRLSSFHKNKQTEVGKLFRNISTRCWGSFFDWRGIKNVWHRTPGPWLISYIMTLLNDRYTIYVAKGRLREFEIYLVTMFSWYDLTKIAQANIYLKEKSVLYRFRQALHHKNS